MSGYDDKEATVEGAQPVEVYKFIGTFKTYRYTSADLAITVNDELYTPLAGLKRNAIKIGTHEDDTLTVEVSFPFDTDVVQDYAYAQSPPSLNLEVRRFYIGTDQATDWRMLWSGPVRGFSVAGRVAKMLVPSVFANALHGDAPNVYYQAPCNHILYDDLCDLNRDDHTTTATIVSVDSITIEVDDDGVADGVLVPGELLNLRTTESRMILGNVANVLTVTYPFTDMIVGDTVELTRGCDHTYLGGCASLGNQARYGGEPDIPSDNPFEGSL